jgi:hypothetical protein
MAYQRLIALASLGAMLTAGDAPAVVPAPSAPTPPAAAAPSRPGAAAPAPAKPPGELGAFSQLAEEEKWTFDPQVTRQDVFYDLESILMQQVGSEVQLAKSDGPTKGAGDAIEALREWAKKELARVEGFVLARKWDDALKATETDIRTLQPRAGDDAAIGQIVEKLKRYRSQAEEAKIYEEAQAKFDALGLRVDGILWSPAGSLAVIRGEPRARAINERVKDCVIINVDTNRVDFLFHYNRRRFEFQRYVGEDLTPASRTR